MMTTAKTSVAFTRGAAPRSGVFTTTLSRSFRQLLAPVDRVLELLVRIDTHLMTSIGSVPREQTMQRLAYSTSPRRSRRRTR